METRTELARQNAARAAISSPGVHARILIVEDNDDAAEGLMMMLETLGHDVEVCPDGPSAVAAARDGAFDLALVDLDLPGIDGYEVARRIRKLPDAGSIVLAALTGFGQDEVTERARQSG